MDVVGVISTTTIKAPLSHNINNSPKKIDLTPWDLQFFQIVYIQRGLLFRNEKHTPIQIEHFQHTLSSTLAFFPPLVGRFVILQHHDNIVSSHIVCNNAGAFFVHAVAHNTTVADILHLKDNPPFVRSFFQLNGVKNYQGTSQPLLAVQVTELVDGIFIAFSINHVATDGKSFWHFVNSWAEISRGNSKISKLPTLERFFLDDTDRPIRFPFTKEEHSHSANLTSQTPTVHSKVFRFEKEKIAELKSKANAEANSDKTISSLQALLTLIWRTMTRCKRVDPKDDVNFALMIDVRPRLVAPPLPENYFGNSVMLGVVKMKAGELLLEGNKGSLEMNKMISSHSREKIKSHYESWVRTQMTMTPRKMMDGILLSVGSSTRFDIYGNDFGLGKPVAVRSGAAATMCEGLVSVFAGAEEGSIDAEVSLPSEVLEAMGNDHEFMHVVSN